MQGQAVCSCTSGSITGEMMVILSPVVSALSTAVGTPASWPDATLVGCGSFRAQDSQCLAETTSPPLFLALRGPALERSSQDFRSGQPWFSISLTRRCRAPDQFTGMS